MYYVFSASGSLVNWSAGREWCETYSACLPGTYIRHTSELTDHERARVDRFAPYIIRYFS